MIHSTALDSVLFASNDPLRAVADELSNRTHSESRKMSHVRSMEVVIITIATVKQSGADR